ncbi:MAG: Spx/MgsR family RNA polymerase-binding regulatory protein [Methylococcales bacterium]|nr:Spx/MgsR family RNA polymerase-binding regulatory protein [Methylococcales bacterium]
MYTLYGITSCSTVTKARRFLDEKKCDYQFYDLKKQPLTEALIGGLEARIGWKIMLNKRSTTWRQLEEAQKLDVDPAKAIALMIRYPTLIKRPLLDLGEQLLVGFKIDDYDAAL